MITIKADRSTKRRLNVIGRIPKKAKNNVRKALYQSGKDIAGTSGSVSDGLIKKEINKKPKTGKVYRIYRGVGGRKLSRPRLHIASRVGESPAVITGRLRGTVFFKVEGFKRLEISAGGKDAPYAKVLEIGGRRIAARRFMIRPILRSRRNIINNFARALKNATK